MMSDHIAAHAASRRERSSEPARGTVRPARLALLAATAAVAGGALWYISGDPGGSWERGQALFTSAGALREFVLGFGAWAPLAFFLVQVAQVIAAPIPGAITTAAGAAIFGMGTGLALSLSATMVGSVAVFAAARGWGRPVAARLVGEQVVARYAGILDDAGGLWLFLMMLLPFLPDDALCAVAGLSRISFWRFLAAVTLGRLPVMALTAYVAAGVMADSTGAWVTGGLVVAALLALAFVGKRIKVKDE